MKNSPLQLEHYCVTAVHLDAKLDAKVPEKIEWRINSTCDFATHRDAPRRWKVDLAITFHAVDEVNSPYRGNISFVGFFAVDDTYSEDKVRLLVETNGPSVLFGAIREMVANLTARGPWPMVLLPTQSFYKGAPQPATDPAGATNPASLKEA